MKINLTISEKLKDLRKEKNFSLEELAEKTGLSKSALGSYEVNDFNIFPFHAERGHEKVTVETGSRQETIL